MRDIKLKTIFPNLDPLDYKLHFAKNAYGTEPLDVFLESFEAWKRWNSSSAGGKDSYNRKYIFSLIKLYSEENTWLFGGVWEVLSRDKRKNYPYEIKPVSAFMSFVGRLVISYEHKIRSIRVNMENHFDGMIVKEILEEPYFYSFPGYENIDISFRKLQLIREKGTRDWREKLSVRGIYLITDTKTGKKYVGKADGANGIWQRWNNYIGNGHGGDVDLVDLVEAKGFEYVRTNYKFTLLEIVKDGVDINRRENYWKDVFLSRNSKFGHNKN